MPFRSFDIFVSFGSLAVLAMYYSLDFPLVILLLLILVTNTISSLCPFCSGALVGCSHGIYQQTLSLLSPQGLRIELSGKQVFRKIKY